MKPPYTPSELERKGLEILERYEAGEINFTDHEFRFAHLGELEFSNWVNDWSISADDVKAYFPKSSDQRIRHLIENPEEILDEEREAWVKFYLANSAPPSGASLFVFIPVLEGGDLQGIAVLTSYGDIPGGEYELHGTFNNQSEAEESLQGMLWYG
jgi:hypothetical protein